MSDFPCNYLAPDPSHALSFHYTAPLRAPSPFSLSLAFTESRPPPRSPQGTHLYAHLVWNASIHLADMIAARELDVQGQRVLELGCGAALPGLLAVCKGASKVVLSDFDDAELIAELGKGVRRTLPAGESQSKMQVVGHTWGEDIAPLLAAGPYDRILCADLLWSSTSHQPLFSTLTQLLTCFPNAIIHFTSGLHTGRQPLRAFFAAARQVGLEPAEGEEWYEISVTGERRAWEEAEQCGEREECQDKRGRWTMVASLRMRRE